MQSRRSAGIPRFSSPKYGCMRAWQHQEISKISNLSGMEYGENIAHRHGESRRRRSSVTRKA